MIGLKFNKLGKINVAKSVTEIITGKNEYAQNLIDRSQTLDEETISAILNQSTLSYAGRTPAPALDKDGNFQCTDLDLFSFLMPMAARGAVIEIPSYTKRRKAVKCAGERRIGESKFGPITGLVSNKDAFSFSVRINDKSVIKRNLQTESENVGAYRNYMLVDCDGFWYNGWNKIVWDPTAKENAFLTENCIFTGNSVVFQYYIHPNRWQSVYGAPYLIKKMLIARIDDEANFYRGEVKRLTEAGIKLPAEEKNLYRQILSQGKTETMEVKSLEVIFQTPDFVGAYTPVANNVEGLIEAYRRQKKLTYSWKAAVQFSTRADEAAFMFYGFNENGTERVGSWIKNASWQSYRASSRSAKYQKLELASGYALLYRIKKITERVSCE